MRFDLVAIVISAIVLAMGLCAGPLKGTFLGFGREHRAIVRAQRRAKARRPAGNASSETPT